MMTKRTEVQHVDWRLLAVSVALAFITIVSIVAAGGRATEIGQGQERIEGLISVVAFLLTPFGIYTPLLGMISGIGGVICFVLATSNLPKLLVWPIAILLVALVMFLCGMSYLLAVL